MMRTRSWRQRDTTFASLTTTSSSALRLLLELWYAVWHDEHH